MWLQSTLLVLMVMVGRVWRVGRRFLAEDEGASLVEYAILVALIAIVAIAAVQALGSAIVQVFQNIVSRLQGLGR